MRRAEVSRGGAEARESEPVPAKNRREQFTRRFAPLTSVPARDLDDILSENRGGA
jgi:hypothetical protein